MQRYSVQQLQEARVALAQTLAKEEQIVFAVIEQCPDFTGLIVRTLSSHMQLIPVKINGVPVVSYPQEKIIHVEFQK